MLDRAKIVDSRFVALLKELSRRPVSPPGDPDGPVRPGSGLTRRKALELFESQVASRHLDLTAREMKARGEGFYTIASSGHEGNAVLGALTRSTDPALLHYRSGAFFHERARKRAGETPLFDTLLSLAASSEDPISGGRHKVFGSRTLAIPPMTSTIASHLPRAVGIAFFLERGKRLELPSPFPRDSIVMVSFGDASVNHSTATDAINAASWAVHQSLPLPLLFVCEDNGLGISVNTPLGWVERSMRGRRGLRYFKADGLDLPSAWDTAGRAVDLCRRLRVPVFLHLDTVRLLGHAGSDVETGYRPLRQIEEAEARDPLAATARLLVESGAATGAELLDLYEEMRTRVRSGAREATRRPKLSGAEAVTAPLRLHRPDAIREEVLRPASAEERIRAFGGEANLPERSGKPRHMGQLVSLGLKDLLARYPDAFVFGEDVARKGGVYYATAGLLDAFGPSRVFNTLLDESTILGIALGAGMLGYLPIPEIQYLAYLHNAEDQLRGEAASFTFFSNHAYRNGMVVRIASFGYQKGFGGHFHNDNSIGVLRDIPGLLIAAPARPADAVRMLRTAAAAVRVDGRVVAFLEPIALYLTKDLYEPGDGGWMEPYPEPGEHVEVGRAAVTGDGDDLLILSYANGFRLSLRVARKLAGEGIGARVVDLRWLAPLDRETIRAETARCPRVLVVDEGRRSGGVGEGIVTTVVEEGPEGVRIERVSGEDTFIPLGDAALDVLPSEAGILEGARKLLRRGSSR